MYWEAPGDWFDGPAIVLDSDSDDVVGMVDAEDPGEPDDRPVVFAREIRPPLRRWAAARVLRSDPACWGALVQRAREVDPRDGAAIMFGLVDGIDVVAPAARGFLLGIADNWPHRKLREGATALRHPPAVAPAPVPEVCAMPPRSAAQASLF